MDDLPPADEVKAEAKATTAVERKDAVGLVTPARIPGQVLPPAGDTFLGRRITPLTRRRIDNFRANRRGFWSLWLFLVLFVASLFAEFIANDRPLLIQYDGAFYFPVFRNYPETAFGGFLPSEADYRDPAVRQMIVQSRVCTRKGDAQYVSEKIIPITTNPPHNQRVLGNPISGLGQRNFAAIANHNGISGKK